MKIGFTCQFKKKTLTNSIEKSVESLEALKQNLKNFTFPKSTIIKFSTNTIEINEIVQDIPVGNDTADYIYLFKIVGKTKSNRELAILLKEEKQKQSSDELKKDLPKINDEHNGTQYLYVGRSHKLRNRIRQHLSEDYKGTYAMHMKRWCTTLDETIELHYYKIENQDNLLIQAIEDSLWLNFKPSFGRKGDK